MTQQNVISKIGLAKSRRNFWKYAFFIALLAFEIAREIAVLAASAPIKSNTSGFFFHQDGFIQAEGIWKRIDGGQPLIDTVVTIKCYVDIERCFEVSTILQFGYISPPHIDRFFANFSPENVSYENNEPACVRYIVKLDLTLNKAFAIRERKESVTSVNCEKLERRIEMQLGDSFTATFNPLTGHFVPIFRVLFAALGM
jgi:hypothetical protein